MRLRTLLNGLARQPKEAGASALVREHFRAMWVTHTALLASDTKAPVVVLADPACDFGRSVCAANGVLEPAGPCVFGSTEEKLLASMRRSPDEKVVTLRRALADLPAASETCMRIVVFTGGDAIVLHYLHSGASAAAAA